ncbi:MAG: DUF3293 domain-containing protein [Pseudoxanthomonas sp.]
MGTTLARLAAAYADAHYFVTIGRSEWLFQVGETATAIERQLQASSYLFVTAWNPHGRPAEDEHNREAGEALQARLQELGWPHLPALGCDSRGGAVEHGWLVLGTSPEQAEALGREFLQAGILHWRAGEPVHLRMLRPAPQDARDLPHVVWAE